jgi:SAM-dependent methyltransferase
MAMDMDMAAYLEGIRRARAEGLIEVASRYDADPGVLQYSNHVPWEIGGVSYPGRLSLTNTRPLHPVIKLALYIFGEDTIRFLELGPGAGNACYELYRLSRALGKKVHICACSFSPVNPYMPIVLSGSRLLRALEGNPAMERAEEGPQGPLWFIGTEAAFETHRQGVETIFQVLDEPYIDHQYIGRYPESPDLGDRRFDVIYDMLGPLHGDEQEAVDDAYGRLTERGFLFFQMDPRYPLGNGIIDGARKGRVTRFAASDTVLVAPGGQLVLVAREACPVSLLVREKLDAPPQAIPLSDITAFLQWLIRDHASR